MLCYVTLPIVSGQVGKLSRRQLWYVTLLPNEGGCCLLVCMSACHLFQSVTPYVISKWTGWTSRTDTQGEYSSFSSPNHHATIHLSTPYTLPELGLNFTLNLVPPTLAVCLDLQQGGRCRSC